MDLTYKTLVTVKLVTMAITALIAVFLVLPPFFILQSNSPIKATPSLPLNTEIIRGGKTLQYAAEGSWFVWNDELHYIFTDRDLSGSTKVMKIIKWSDQSLVSSFGSGYGCQDVIVDNSTLYIFATTCNMDFSHKGNNIVKFTTTDLTSFSGPTTVKTMDGNTQVYNVSVTKSPSDFVLAYEVATTGYTSFAMKFIKSSDTSTWTNTGGTVGSTGTFGYGCPEIKYINGEYYIFIGGVREILYAVDQNPTTKVITPHYAPRYETWLTKSSDLSTWGWSRLAVLTPKEDYEDINTGDFDAIEYDGKVWILYLVSNQLNYIRLHHATYEGTLQNLVDAYYQTN